VFAGVQFDRNGSSYPEESGSGFSGDDNSYQQVDSVTNQRISCPLQCHLNDDYLLERLQYTTIVQKLARS
jgi:hypothetical protein